MDYFSLEGSGILFAPANIQEARRILTETQREKI